MNVSSFPQPNLLNPIRALSTMVTQKSESFNDALFNSQASTPIAKKLSMDIDRELKVASPKQNDFSFKASSELVSQRFNRKDFSIFMPPSAMDVYKA